jgi:hypothetical protein
MVSSSYSAIFFLAIMATSHLDHYFHDFVNLDSSYNCMGEFNQQAAA